MDDLALAGFEAIARLSGFAFVILIGILVWLDANKGMNGALHHRRTGTALTAGARFRPKCGAQVGE